MYDRINRTILGIAVVVAFTCALVPGALAEREEHGCSLRTLKGTWGFVFQGTIIGFGPIAIVGIATFDGAGNWSRNERAVVNGNVLPHEVITGTYTVNDTCTGTTTDSLGHTSEFVIVANRREMLSIGPILARWQRSR